MTEWVSGNIFIRDNGGPLNAAQTVGGHTHNFDHTTLCIKGTCRVTGTLPSGEVKSLVLNAGQHCLIKANVLHEIEALEDGAIVYCIFAHRDPQTGEVVQQYNGNLDAYV